jgi:hypothetical protein
MIRQCLEYIDNTKQFHAGLVLFIPKMKFDAVDVPESLPSTRSTCISLAKLGAGRHPSTGVNDWRESTSFVTVQAP